MTNINTLCRTIQFLSIKIFKNVFVQVPPHLFTNPIDNPNFTLFNTKPFKIFHLIC